MQNQTTIQIILIVLGSPGVPWHSKNTSVHIFNYALFIQQKRCADSLTENKNHNLPSSRISMRSSWMTSRSVKPSLIQRHSTPGTWFLSEQCSIMTASCEPGCDDVDETPGATSGNALWTPKWRRKMTNMRFIHGFVRDVRFGVNRLQYIIFNNKYICGNSFLNYN